MKIQFLLQQFLNFQYTYLTNFDLITDIDFLSRVDITITSLLILFLNVVNFLLISFFFIKSILLNTITSVFFISSLLYFLSSFLT